jgi:hypothetical protein
VLLTQAAVAAAVETRPLLGRLAALVLLFFQFLLQVTQAQPQVHQQLQPAVLIQF